MAVIRRKVHTKAKKVVHKVAKKAVKRAPTKVFKKSVKVPAKKVVKKPVKKMAAKKVPAAKTPQPKGVANLLITFDPNHAGLAQTEVVSVCERCGSKPVFLKSDVEGLFKIIVPDAKQLVRKLRAACITAPESFLATFHYAPITKWCKSDIESIKKAVKELLPGIGPQDRWKMQLNKRNYPGESTDLILKITSVVDRSNVDLTDPEKIIQVEIIGKDAGVSLLAAHEFLSVPKIKQN